MADTPEPRKKKIQWEARLISEYVALTYPANRAFFNLQVGPLASRILDQDLSPSEARALGTYRPRIDAIVVFPQEIICIEAWIVTELGKAGQLHAYMRLIPNTPELGELARRPMRGVIVGPFEHPVLKAETLDFGYSFVVYRPHWIEDAVASRSGSKARDNRRNLLLAGNSE